VSDEFKTREQLLAEVNALRRRMSEVEERRKRAEEALRAIEHRDQVLGDSAPFGIFTIDVQGRITGLNQKMMEIFQWPAAEDVASVNLFEFQPMLETGAVGDFRRCIQKREPIVTNYPCITSQGECLSLRFHLSPVPDDAGTVSGVLAFVEDMTSLKLAEDAVQENEERYRMLFQSTPVALIERDASQLKAYLGRLRASGVTDFSSYLGENPQEVGHCMSMIKTVDYNDAFLQLLEAHDREELKNGITPADPKEFHRMARRIILLLAEGNISQEREETVLTLKGNKRNVLGKALIVSGHEDTFARIVISLVDISKRKQAEEALRASEQHFREQAMRDILTGLYNRRYLYQSLSELIEPGKSAQSPLSLIFMDLDCFKDVVDTHGHLNGSRAIREVAATIRNCIEEPAYAVAFAGDEFVVVLPGLNQARAEETALIIRSRMNSTVYLLEQGLEVRLQASFGIATFPDHAGNLTELLASADRALFAVKERGKGRIGWADIPASRVVPS